MDDGLVDDTEAERLDEIAQSVGLTLSEFVNSYFLSEGEDFLRGIFAACTEGGFLLENVWDSLVATSQRLGLAQESLIEAILPQADRFFEHVLADAKADGELTEHEEAHVLELVRTLNLPAERRKYVENTIAALRTIPIPPHLIKSRGTRTDTPQTHISREVRQRIWQRYAGRCAECGAHECLEFDHIVPIEKGGSNSDANVQLLCRTCILKNADLLDSANGWATRYLRSEIALRRDHAIEPIATTSNPIVVGSGTFGTSQPRAEPAPGVASELLSARSRSRAASEMLSPFASPS